MSDIRLLASALDSLGRLVPDGASLVGVGWATVDAERTMGSLGGDRVAGPGIDEPALGAMAWVVPGPVALVVLEPSTEGRLAAALARRGEGIACLYVTGAARVEGGRPTALGRAGRLLPHDRPWGPFVILLTAPTGIAAQGMGSRSP